MKFDINEFRKKMRKRLPRWINLQNLIFFAVIAAFAIIVVWSESISMIFQDASPQELGITATPTTLFGTPTPLPAEWLASAEQTNGILIGGVIVILTIILGAGAIYIRDKS